MADKLLGRKPGSKKRSGKRSGKLQCFREETMGEHPFIDDLPCPIEISISVDFQLETHHSVWGSS